MSSIFRIERTVSVAKVMALMVTKSGCATPSSSIFVMAPCKEKKLGFNSKSMASVVEIPCGR